MINKERYQRQIALPQFGAEGQMLLSKATIVVVGVGGLGCPALQFLAAAGIGTIKIIDHDLISMSNLNRQVLYNPSDVGKHKAEVAGEKVLAQNPDLKVITHTLKLTQQNAEDLFSNSSLILDCTDNPATRYVINDACVSINLPFIYAGIHKMEGQLAVLNFNNGTTYRCIFPESDKLTGPNCEENGVLGTVSGILGTMQAQEAIKILTMPDSVNGNELLVFNFLDNSINRIATKRTESDRVSPTQNDIVEISATELADALQFGKSFTFVDVREEYEEPSPTEFEAISLPLSNWKIEYSLHAIPKNEPVIVFCQKGIRSEMAIAAIPPERRNNLINLKGGLNAWKSIKINT